jgi:hypothetical protein
MQRGNTLSRKRENRKTRKGGIEYTRQKSEYRITKAPFDCAPFGFAPFDELRVFDRVGDPSTSSGPEAGQAKIGKRETGKNLSPARHHACLFPVERRKKNPSRPPFSKGRRAFFVLNWTLELWHLTIKSLHDFI